MNFDPSNPSNRGSLGEHKATILKKIIADGNVKIYTDPQGVVEKTDISIPEGKIVVIKDYEVTARLAKYKKIDVYSNTEQKLDTVDIISENSMMHTYTFYFHGNAIGKGSGDLGTALASGFFPDAVDPRLLAGSAVDPEVIKVIKDVLQEKRI
jgi:hypothetical protein